MAVRTLTGEIKPVRTPYSSLTPNERKLLKHLSYYDRGLTEKELKRVFGEHMTVGNRLRSLRAKGWVFNYKPRRGEQRWVAVKD